MPPLSAASRALLTEISAAYGVSPVEPDDDALIRIDIDGQPVALAFAEVWGSVLLISVLTLDSADLGGDVFAAFAVQSRLSGPTTRVARDPRSGALVLVAELVLEGLRYPAFAAALRVFLSDRRLALQHLGLTGGPPSRGHADRYRWLPEDGIQV